MAEISCSCIRPAD